MFWNVNMTLQCHETDLLFSKVAPKVRNSHITDKKYDMTTPKIALFMGFLQVKFGCIFDQKKIVDATLGDPLESKSNCS